MQVLGSRSPPHKAWFTQVDSICKQYSLPSALHLLTHPSSKLSFKSTVKSAVINFWEQQLRREAAELASLKYFHTQFYSLTTPHLIWSTAGSNHWKSTKPLSKQGCWAQISCRKTLSPLVWKHCGCLCTPALLRTTNFRQSGTYANLLRRLSWMPWVCSFTLEPKI